VTALAELAVGASRTTVLVEDLTRTRIVQYAGASGDYNPLHTDEVYATKIAGYPSVFAHGMLTMAMTGRVVTDLFGADKVTRFGARFVSQVWPGDTLTVTATVGEVSDGIAEVTLSTRNQSGQEVLSGYASARVD